VVPIANITGYEAFLLATMYASMAVAALIVELIFKVWGWFRQSATRGSSKRDPVELHHGAQDHLSLARRSAARPIFAHWWREDDPNDEPAATCRPTARLFATIWLC
jgi:hypothetical protein